MYNYYSRFLVSPPDVDLAAGGEEGEEPLPGLRVGHHHALERVLPQRHGRHRHVQAEQPAPRTLLVARMDRGGRGGFHYHITVKSSCSKKYLFLGLALVHGGPSG